MSDDIEDGISRCCRYQKDSWERWTSMLRFFMFTAFMCLYLLYSAIQAGSTGMIYMSIMISIVTAWMLFWTDRARANFRAEWDLRIASWIELREQSNNID